MSASKAWSVRTVNSKKGSYALIQGKAYPDVLKGKNPTRTVRADHKDRQSFYHDPAIKLSEADLNDIDGAHGAPLCYEHKKNDVVGSVRHSWIGDDGKCLKIWGHIPLNTRGKQIVQDIQCGKIKGFSVGYGADMECPDGNLANKELMSKSFNEISLVCDPFFEGCNLTVGVFASADEQDSAAKPHRLYIPIEMSANPAAPTDSSSAPAPTAPVTNAAAPAAPQQGSIMPPGSQHQEAEEILKQADMLKEQSVADRQEKEAMAAELAFYRKKSAEEAERYKKEREPQAQEYIAEQEKLLGKPLDEAIKKQYYGAFTNPKFKDNADLLWKQHKHTVELTASAKARDEELAAVKIERAKLTETLSKVGQQVGGMRASYAQSLSAEMTPAQSEAKTAMLVGAVSASGKLRANEIMCAMPSANELPFLVDNGFSNPLNASVNASSNEYDQHKTIRTSVQAAREHRLLRDENGELQFPASMRYHFPQGMGWFCNESGLDSADNNDLSNYVQLNSARTFMERKGVDEYKQAAL